MSVKLNTVNTYQNTYHKSFEKEKIDKNSDEKSSNQVELSAEAKLKQADEFWMKHDQLYAEQQAAVMNTITDGMAVAQAIYRRMASGAKVSSRDEQNLMEYDFNMYMAAKNAQMMAKRHEDMSKDSLVEDFEKRHANDRKDWTSELNDKIGAIDIQSDADAAFSTTETTETGCGSIDISV